MKIPVSKLPTVGTTIFTTMSALAQEVGAVNLGQGFPDFACDPRLLDLMNEAMRAGFNQYPPMIGIPALREEIAKKVWELYGREYEVATEITVTAGPRLKRFMPVARGMAHPYQKKTSHIRVVVDGEMREIKPKKEEAK